MEPARSPEEEPQEQPQETLEDILREANELLHKSPQQAGSGPAPPPGPPELTVHGPAQGGAAQGPTQAPRTAAPSASAGVKYEADQRRRNVEVPRAAEPAFRLTPARITALALGTLAALAWGRLLLFGTYTPPVIDPTYAEASMRWALVLTSKRVEDFRLRYHRTPSTLSEIGHVPAPIGYERVSFDRYLESRRRFGGGPPPHGGPPGRGEWMGEPPPPGEAGGPPPGGP